MDTALLHKQKPNFARALLPKTLTLLLLCCVFYILILLNLYFIFVDVDSSYIYLSLALIIVLFIAETVKNYFTVQHMSYTFYGSKVDNGKTTVLYNEITKISFEQDFFDKLLNTGSIILKPDFKIRYINNSNKVYFYIQKLIKRSRLVKP